MGVMPLVLLSLLAVLPPGTSVTDTEELTFADVPWGAEADVVTARLTAVGFSLRTKGDDGNLVFLGNVNDHNAIVLAWMAQGQLVRFSVRLLTAAAEVERVYEDTRRRLEDAHGEPIRDLAPSGTLAAFWRRGENDAFVKVSAEQTVDISYESAAWRAEFERLTKRRP
jgi:hypothetical protein